MKTVCYVERKLEPARGSSRSVRGGSRSFVVAAAAPPHAQIFFVGFTILTILTIIARDNLSIQSRDGAGGMDHADILALRRNARQNTFAPY